MNYTQTKRAWIISDTHFGVRNSSLEWLEIQKDYFRDFFLPLLRENVREGDIVIHCGDTFDSRHSLNLLVMNEGMQIMKEISEIAPMIMILGNHDIYRRNSNEINSVKMLGWLPNIEVLEDPRQIQMSGKNILFMPWRATVEDANECIKSYPSDYLFCHIDMKGMHFNRYTEIEEGLEVDLLKNFRKVYSGHIHYAQAFNNVRLVGCPYQLTRSDAGNEKGIWMLDIENDIETYFPNTVSPIFQRFMFEGLLEKTVDEINELFRNNFVDIMVHPRWSLAFPFALFIEDLNTYKKLDLIPRIDEKDSDIEDIEGSGEKIDIVTVAERVIAGSSHSEILKDKIMQKVKQLYQSVQREFSQEEVQK